MKSKLVEPKATRLQAGPRRRPVATVPIPAGQRSADRRILQEMLSIPTAPFAEHQVIHYILKALAGDRRIRVRQDEAGNILVRVRQAALRVRRPVCITAHLDHPGFVAQKMVKGNILQAAWRGGVAAEYFVGSSVRFFEERGPTVGVVQSIRREGANGSCRVSSAEISVPRPVARGAIGMWDLPEPAFRGNTVSARACDDIAGAAAMMACIRRLTADAKPCDAYFLFTRAEEVGFVGAMAAVNLGTIPRNCFVVAMETSSLRPNAQPGDGPILRVGDKATTFHHPATAHCRMVADRIALRNSSFRYQRRLMDGGTCESSAYSRLGLEATGICIALGNYHNMDVARKRIAPEFVDMRDWRSVVEWFVALARPQPAYDPYDVAFRNRLLAIQRKHSRLLQSSVIAAK